MWHQNLMKLVEIVVLLHKFSRPNDFTHKGINFFYLNRHSKNISRYLVKYVLDIILVCTLIVFSKMFTKMEWEKTCWPANNDSVIIVHSIIHKLYYNAIDYREKISGIVLNVIIHSILFSFHSWKIVPCHGGLSAKIVTYLPGKWSRTMRLSIYLYVINLYSLKHNKYFQEYI